MHNPPTKRCVYDSGGITQAAFVFSLVGSSIEIDGDEALIDTLLPEIRRLKPELIVLLSANDEVVCNESTIPGDDRRYCRQCLNLSATGFCIAEKFRPTDDMPRRCAKFRDNGRPAPLSWLEERDIREWLASIGETDEELIEETIQRCRTDLDARRYFLKRADDITEQTTPAATAKRTCQECRHWQRDTIGDGSGLGECLIDAPRRGLPWPNQTACNQFQGVTND